MFPESRFGNTLFLQSDDHSADSGSADAKAGGVPGSVPVAIMGLQDEIEAPALGDRVQWYATADDDLLAAIESYLRPGDSVLIKGSNRVFWANGFVAQLIEQLTS